MEAFLHHELQKVLAMDVSYTDESGLGWWMLLKSSFRPGHRKRSCAVCKGLVSRQRPGSIRKRKSAQPGVGQWMFLFSEDLRKTRAKIVCTNRSCDCRQPDQKHSSEPVGTCLKCSSPLTIEEEVDIVSDLSKLAELSGAEVKIISTEFEEGAQLFRAFGGIAAILRYKTSHI